MIRYALTAAVAALALSAPFAVHAQAYPQPMPQAAPNMTINANATIVGQPQPGPNDYDQGYANPGMPAYGAPMPGPYAQPISPRTTWIPGHYEWDPNANNYAWTDGRYVEAPRENAQWVPGHWRQTPTSWIWINGNWN
jgi:hypothetical protein